MPTPNFPRGGRVNRTDLDLAPCTEPPGPAARDWRRNARFVLGLLTAWFSLTVVPAWFAGDLAFSVFGWPFPFWMAAYGAPLGYLAIIVFYARAMNRGETED